MSNLVNHAKRELKLAGFNPDYEPVEGEFDYDNEVALGVIKIVQQFADEGHSGMSAGMSLSMLTKLLNFESLTPLTDNPEEWAEHQNHGGVPFWQNRRQSDSFSLDGGKTYYRLDTERKGARFLRRLPNPIYFWVWTHMTGLFYPMHTSQPTSARSLDTASVSR